MSTIYDLYPKGRDLIGITPNGPPFGKLTITDEIDQKAQPYPMQKCTLELYDQEALYHWGDSRNTFWIHQGNDPLTLALRHLNGQE